MNTHSFWYPFQLHKVKIRGVLCESLKYPWNYIENFMKRYVANHAFWKGIQNDWYLDERKFRWMKETHLKISSEIYASVRSALYRWLELRIQWGGIGAQLKGNFIRRLNDQPISQIWEAKKHIQNIRTAEIISLEWISINMIKDKIEMTIHKKLQAASTEIRWFNWHCLNRYDGDQWMLVGQ